MQPTSSRRDVLKWSALSLGASLVPTALWPQRLRAEAATPKQSFRVAHLTDFHIQPERAAGEGVAACLRHVQGLAKKPSLILGGGDLVMDSAAQNFDRTKTQWDLLKSVLKAECSLPFESCMGNHDIWGWHKKSQTAGNEPLWGKRWFCEEFGLEKPYRSFDQGGWHFILLDSIAPHEKTLYEGRLDDEQFAWLESDLAATPSETPVVLVSHIPLLAVCVIAGGTKQNEEGDYIVGHSNMHVDFPKLKQLFLKHRNVKLCLSGHTHLQDRADYNGVSYLCNGAVCGGWWKGDHQQTKAGYGVIDLYEDGTFSNEYVQYGWTPREA